MKTKALITTAIVGALGLGLLAAAPGYAKGPGYGGGRGAMMFERFDADGDGKVTFEEFQVGHDERFKQMDVDGDGAVTQDEAREAMQKMRAEYRSKGAPGKGKGPCGGGMGPGQGQPQQ